MLISMIPWTSHAETTLKQTMDWVKQHPKLHIAELNNDASRASLSASSAYAYNPELSIEVQDRKLNSGGRATDYYIGLSQGIEIAGKGTYREQVARASLKSSKYQAEILRQALIADAARAFVLLYEAEQALNIRQQQSDLLQGLNQGVQKQLDVGDANILQANLAAASYASALSALTQAKQDYTLALSAYRQATGKFDNTDIHPNLPQLDTSWKAPDHAYDVALQARPELAALTAQAEQGQAQAELANASRYVDPTLSLMGGREAGEQLFKLGISFPIPLTNSKKGEYKASLAQAEVGQSRVLWFKQQLQSEVQAALQNHSSAMMVLRVFEQQQSNSNSIALAKSAFEAGELNLEDLVLHMNQALDANLTALNLIKQGWLARIHLTQVLGHTEYILQGIKQ
jgi:outer membrane protein TolC